MARRRLAALSATVPLVLAGCSSADEPAGPAANDGRPTATADQRGGASDGRPFTTREVASFDEPWAMDFLPDGRALVTEKGGTLRLVDVSSGASQEVTGTPDVEDDGQGGLGDIVPGPTFERDGTVYVSWATQADGGNQAVLGRARLVTDGEPRLEGLAPIWRQDPSSGTGHYSHRIAVAPDGRHLFLSSGDRQKMTPAQDPTTNLGKVLRLNLDGTPAQGNPFADRGGKAAEVWSYGHRNVLGLEFDAAGTLWASEMGPQGGDELNVIERGGNYGWPQASSGTHYDGRDIPDHADGDGFVAPKAAWTPSISPGSLMIYTGDAFPAWKGDAFVGALSGQALVRADIEGDRATATAPWDMGERIREVEQGPDGSVWLLEDGDDGKLVQLTPAG